MSTIALVAVTVVAVLHLFIFVLEAVLWTKPYGRRTFGMTAEFAESTRVLALNQGAYNGGIGLLLLWSSYTYFPASTSAILVFIAAMGLVGGLTAKKSILAIQMTPALVALALVNFT